MIIIKSFLSNPFKRNNNMKYTTKNKIVRIIIEIALIEIEFFIINNNAKGINEIKKTLNIFLLKGIIEV